MAEDRTSEFLALARSLPANGNSGLTASGQSTTSSVSSGRYGRNDASTKSNPAYAQLKDFHTTAGGISRDIAATSAMLSELAQLVRQKSLFVDDTQRVNGLVMRIKTSIENLNGRLDDAGNVIAQQKRQLGKNSQAGQEASNLVGQLKEEFVQATAGFKKVLQQRTDVMKETSDRKRQVYGGDGNEDNPMPILSLENKPPVYVDSGAVEKKNSHGGFGGGAGMSSSAQIGSTPNTFPSLDLTSGMAAGESSASGSHLPRPRKSFAFTSQPYVSEHVDFVQLTFRSFICNI